MVGAFVAGAAAALIGVSIGQGLRILASSKRTNARIDIIEQCIPQLITRAEVQNAFAEVAQIEAQRMAQEQTRRKPEMQFQPQAVQTSAGMNQRYLQSSGSSALTIVVIANLLEMEWCAPSVSVNRVNPFHRFVDRASVILGEVFAIWPLKAIICPPAIALKLH